MKLPVRRKASSDHPVSVYLHTCGLPTLIANCSTHYGPYQFPEKFIPLIIHNARQGSLCRYATTARMLAIGSTSAIIVRQSSIMTKGFFEKVYLSNPESGVVNST